MKILLEIDRWEDLVTLKELLNGNGLIKMNEPLPAQMWETAAEFETRTGAGYAQQGAATTQDKPAETKKAAANPRKAGNGAKSAEKPKEEQTAAAGPDAAADAPEEPDAASAPEIDPSNPFADDVEEEIAPKKPKKLTRDDVNVAFKKYIDVYGQAAAMQDVTALLSETFGVKAIRDIPNNQDAFTKAIIAVADAIDGNRFERAKI